MNSYIQAHGVLEPLYERFGRVVLLALAKETQQPTHPNWAQLTFEATQAMPYLRTLSGPSLAVVFGPASGRLCGIGFHEPPAARDYLAKNPALKDTLVSTGPQGTIIWLRIKAGYCPRAQNLITCAWLAEGAYTLVYNHEVCGPRVEWSGGPKPVELAFDGLQWDAADDFELLPQRLQSRYGPPELLDGKNQRRLNYDYWACFYAHSSSLQYHPGQKRFLRPNPQGEGWLPVYEEVILKELQRLLMTLGQAKGLTTLQRPLLAQERREFLKSLTIVAVGEFAGEADGLTLFLTQQVARNPGADVTSEELFLAYGCFCQNHRLVTLTRHQFLRQSPARIKDWFGISPSHDLARESGQRRGYLNLALKPLEPLPAEERTLRTLRTA